VYKLDSDNGYDVSKVDQALTKSFEWGDRIPIGVFFQDEQPIYEDSEPVLKQAPLVQHRAPIERTVFDSLVEEFM
jgi:2-oxoglutarate ferredoxin oxidoreductase subunit beta